MTPNERERVELKALRYKEKLPEKLEVKDTVLKTALGRGLLLILVSMIKYR